MRNTASRFAVLLAGGDRRSIGRANEVAEIVHKRPKRFRELVACLWNEDPIVRMRAADAAEKASALRPALLAPFKAEMLGLLAETTQQEIRWHLAQMIPRLKLDDAERRRASTAFNSFLSDRGSLVRTAAMQGLADLAGTDARHRSQVADLIENLMRTGTPAMRARGRQLLRQLRGSAG